MLEFFADNFSDCVWLAVVLISMIPMLESKVAIPFALSKQIWGESVLSPVEACVFSLVGSMIPAIILLAVCKGFKNKVMGFVVDKENKFVAKVGQLSEKASVMQKCVYLAGFVAFPMPLTGLYTGSVIAGLSNLCWWKGLLSLFAGGLILCVGIDIICCLFENSAFFVFLFAVAVAVLICLANVVLWVVRAIKKKRGA